MQTRVILKKVFKIRFHPEVISSAPIIFLIKNFSVISPLVVSVLVERNPTFPDGNQPPAAPCKSSSSFPNVYRKLVTIKL